jgi:hypothetical protein
VNAVELQNYTTQVCALTAKNIQNLNTMNKEYKDYPPRTIAWKKWCTDINYRRREWQFRMGVAEYAKHNAHKAFNIR